MQGKPIWNNAKCVLCGGCAAVCPAEAITILPESVSITDKCTCCKLCVDICPTNALDKGGRT